MIIEFTAGQSWSLNLPGDHLALITAADPVWLDVNGERVSLAEGMTFTRANRPWDQIVLISDTAQEIDLYVGYGRVTDSGFHRQLSVSGGVRIQGATVLSGFDYSVSAWYMLPMLVGQSRVVVGNYGSSGVVSIYSADTLTKYFDVDPGESVELKIAMDVYIVVNPGSHARGWREGYAQ